MTTVTPEIDDLLLEAQKTFQAIDDVVKGLGVPPTVGIYRNSVSKAQLSRRKTMRLTKLKTMVADLEKENSRCY